MGRPGNKRGSGYNKQISSKKRGTYKTRAEKRGHYIVRIHQRYGIRLDYERYETWVKGLSRKSCREEGIEYEFVLTQSQQRKIFIIHTEGQEVVSIYDNLDSCWLTALPPHSLEDPGRIVPYRLTPIREKAVERYWEVYAELMKEYKDHGNGKEYFTSGKYKHPSLCMAYFEGKRMIGRIWQVVLSEYKDYGKF